MGRTILRRHHSLPSSSPLPPPPDVDTVVSSLRNCSLSSCHHRVHRHPPRLPVSSSDIAVELKSDLPLPYPWEQVLNLQTGEIYYINRGTGTKTTHDPRERNGTHGMRLELEEDDGYASSEEESSKSGSCCSSSGGGGGYCSSGDVSSDSSTISTAASSTSRMRARRLKDLRGGEMEKEMREVLVLVGCRVCLTLSMVSRTGDADCPKCGSHLLLHF